MCNSMLIMHGWHAPVKSKEEKKTGKKIQQKTKNRKKQNHRISASTSDSFTIYLQQRNNFLISMPLEPWKT